MASSKNIYWILGGLPKYKDKFYLNDIKNNLINACGPLAFDKNTKAKDISPDPKKRVEKNLTEGRGFRLSDQMGKNDTTYSFASSNPLWKATLDILDFMPLVSANYSGGIVITDWYSEKDNPNQSIKITVRFLTNEIRSDALDLKIFYKICKTQNNCIVNERTNDLAKELKKEILKKATIYQQQAKAKKDKKESSEAEDRPDVVNKEAIA